MFLDKKTQQQQNKKANIENLAIAGNLTMDLAIAGN